MKHNPLRNNRDFLRAYKRGKSFVHPLVVLYVGKNRQGTTRLGITASKKVGGAVQRNRARRVITAAARQVIPCQLGGLDLVLVARGATVRSKSTQLAAALRVLLDKAGLKAKETG